MSRSSAAQRPLTFFLTAVLAVLALMVASLAVLPSASATTEDDAVQTSAPAAVETAAQDDAAAVTEEPEAPEPSVEEEDAPAEPEAPVVVAAVPPAEEFEVHTYGPECWDSSWNVDVYYDGDATDLLLVLQEQLDGAWLDAEMTPFRDGYAGVWSEMLEVGQTATYQVAVYDRTAPTELVVLAGPVTVTGVEMGEDCEGWELPELPEEQWTVAEPDCGTITFTSHADVEVVVLWFGEDDFDEYLEENYFFLAPGESRTVETSEEWLYWVSAVGVDEELTPIEGEFAYAGEGEVEVSQDCPPAEPTEPAQPGGGHTIPGKVQTDGGADATTVALGLMLMVAAAVGLLRRTV